MNLRTIETSLFCPLGIGPIAASGAPEGTSFRARDQLTLLVPATKEVNNNFEVAFEI